MYDCCAEDERIAVLVTYVDDTLLTRDYEAPGMVNHLLKRYEGRDLSVPDNLVGVALMATGTGTKLDQAPYTKSIVKEGMSCLDVRRAFIPLSGVFCGSRLVKQPQVVSHPRIYASPQRPSVQSPGLFSGILTHRSSIAPITPPSCFCPF